MGASLWPASNEAQPLGVQRQAKKLRQNHGLYPYVGPRHVVGLRSYSVRGHEELQTRWIGAGLTRRQV